ncbi:MAG TPA: hypothetical protein VD838_16400 [Anaeromyxobacteraceae bacterium]|nr:hypothetical protein [Anaeromyxobacteraceae bacterium]
MGWNTWGLPAALALAGALAGCDGGEAARLAALNERSYALARGGAAERAQAEREIVAALRAPGAPAGAPVTAVRCARPGVAFGEGRPAAADTLGVRLCGRLVYLRWMRGDLRGALIAYSAAVPYAHLLRPETRTAFLRGGATIAASAGDTARAILMLDDAHRVARTLGLNREAAGILRCQARLLDPHGEPVPPEGEGRGRGDGGVPLMLLALWLVWRRKHRASGPAGAAPAGAAPAGAR